MTDNTFHVTVRREDPWWVAVIDGVGATEARRIAELEGMVRDLIVSMRDLDDPGLLDLTWHYDLPQPAAKALEDYQHSRQALIDAERLYNTNAEQAAKALGQAHISIREAAQLMRLSFQRVQQLRARGAREA